ncbi:hypothetical protein V3C33_15715 [Micrococcaceae bacterium Sec5.7]
MDESLGKFIDEFAQLVQLAQAGQHAKSTAKQLLAAVTEHLHVPAEGLAVVVEDIPPHRFVDADIVLAEIAGARELVRRAVVAAALEGVPVSDSHLGSAVEVLMADGEAVTRRLLGSGAGPESGAPGFAGPGSSATGFPGPAAGK